jgi:ABC-type nitrate/sulfonate/bicarbonate transport system permease component
VDRLRSAVLLWWLPAAIVAAWEAAARLHAINPLFFPAPSAIAGAGWAMILAGEWQAQLAGTLRRLIAGCVPGLAAGFVCGLLMGAAASVRKGFEPLLSALNSTPKLALMPLFLILLGVGEPARLIPITLTGFVTLAMQTLDAVRGVDRAYVELARNHGAGRWAMLRRVYVPACLPPVFTGLRLAAGRALVITISVELLGTPDGLGRMIWLAWQTLATEKLYVGILTTTLLGVVFHNGLKRLEVSLAPWAAAREGGAKS